MHSHLARRTASASLRLSRNSSTPKSLPIEGGQINHNQVAWRSSSLLTTTTTIRTKSSQPESLSHETSYPFDENGNAATGGLHVREEYITFPASSSTLGSGAEETKPILMNSSQHAVGYLSKILNAKCYEAAVETQLQHAKNLSAVSSFRNVAQLSFCCCNYDCGARTKRKETKKKNEMIEQIYPQFHSSSSTILTNKVTKYASLLIFCFSRKTLQQKILRKINLKKNNKNK